MGILAFDLSYGKDLCAAHLVGNNEPLLVSFERDSGYTTDEQLMVWYHRIYSYAKGNRDTIHAIAYELPPYVRNQKVYFTFGKLCGIIEVVASQLGIPSYNATVQEVKKSLSGKGNGKKPEMIKAANKRFKLNLTTKEEDFADALGVAVCVLERLASMNEH